MFLISVYFNSSNFYSSKSDHFKLEFYEIRRLTSRGHYHINKTIVTEFHVFLIRI